MQTFGLAVVAAVLAVFCVLGGLVADISRAPPPTLATVQYVTLTRIEKWPVEVVWRNLDGSIARVEKTTYGEAVLMQATHEARGPTSLTMTIEYAAFGSYIPKRQVANKK